MQVSTAIALTRKGHVVTVLEAQKSFSEVRNTASLISLAYLDHYLTFISLAQGFRCRQTRPGY
jgi:hypothetical protein